MASMFHYTILHIFDFVYYFIAKKLTTVVFRIENKHTENPSTESAKNLQDISTMMVVSLLLP